MYSSLDKIDLLAERDGAPYAVQTDHRGPDEIEAEPELSVLFAMTRVHNARTHLARQGHANARVEYALPSDAPPLLREAVACTGGMFRVLGDPSTDLPSESPQPSPERASPEQAALLADRMFGELATRVLTRIGTSDLRSALRTLEAETTAEPPDRGWNEAGYFGRILELAAVCGELLRIGSGGRWVAHDQPLIPFGFRIDGDEGVVVFPTSRAQRVIDEGPDESLFALLRAADEAASGTVTHGRVMPSLRSRSRVPLDDIVWRPILDAAHEDLPIVAYGNDGETTFAFCTRAQGLPVEALAEEALRNLRSEAVQVDPIEVQGFRLIVVSGGFYAAEKILDRVFLDTLHQRLSATLLAVAAPARGLMMVTSAVQEPERIATFAELVRSRFEEAASHAVSPAVMIVSGGEVVGFARVGESSPASEPTPTEPRSGWFRRWFGNT